MNFAPIEDWRNWRTRTRQARTKAGLTITVAEDVTLGHIYLGSGVLLLTDMQLTAAEAFALGTELLNAAMQAKAQPTEAA